MNLQAMANKFDFMLSHFRKPDLSVIVHAYDEDDEEDGHDILAFLDLGTEARDAENVRSLPNAHARFVKIIHKQAKLPGREWYPMAEGLDAHETMTALKKKVDEVRIDPELYCQVVTIIAQATHMWVKISGLSGLEEEFKLPAMEDITGLFADPHLERRLHGMIGFGPPEDAIEEEVVKVRHETPRVKIKIEDLVDRDVTNTPLDLSIFGYYDQNTKSYRALAILHHEWLAKKHEDAVNDAPLMTAETALLIWQQQQSVEESERWFPVVEAASILEAYEDLKEYLLTIHMTTNIMRAMAWSVTFLLGNNLIMQSIQTTSETFTIPTRTDVVMQYVVNPDDDLEAEDLGLETP